MCSMFREVFGEGKVVIGVLHLPPLPGSPAWRGLSLEDILEYALRNAERLEKGGVDGIIVENFGDAPFPKVLDDAATLAAFAVVVREVSRSVSVPVGVNVLRNSFREAVAVSCVCGGRFVRINAYTDTLVTDQGIIEPCARELTRYMRALGCRVAVLADVMCKHSTPLFARDIEEAVKTAFGRGSADAVIVTGEATGEAPDPLDVVRAKDAAGDRPVLVGSGMTPENVRLYSAADGYIVGTYFEVGGEVSEDRVKRFVEAVKTWT